MQRYFINDKALNEPFITITGEDYYHIKVVMRMKKGDKAYLCCNDITYLSHIDNITDDEVVFLIDEKIIEHKELPFTVCIAQGLVRKEKMEEVIDYTTEMGASTYLPVLMERSVVKYNKEKEDKKLERLNKIAKEASEQSHRTKILEVKAPVSFNEFIEYSKEYDLCLYAYEKSPKDDSLKQILKKGNYKKIIVLIGPEGGISLKEIDLLKKAGFLPISLGPRILRTQVAPLYFMAALSYEVECDD